MQQWSSFQPMCFVTYDQKLKQFLCWFWRTWCEHPWTTRCREPPEFKKEHRKFIEAFFNLQNKTKHIKSIFKQQSVQHIQRRSFVQQNCQSQQIGCSNKRCNKIRSFDNSAWVTFDNSKFKESYIQKTKRRVNV